MGECADFMKQLYYIEKKSYFRLRDGIEYQCADGGELPQLFTSFKKAVESMQFSREFREHICGEEITYNMGNEEGLPEHLLDRFETICPKTNIRTMFSLYKVWVS